MQNLSLIHILIVLGSVDHLSLGHGSKLEKKAKSDFILIYFIQGIFKKTGILIIPSWATFFVYIRNNESFAFLKELINREGLYPRPYIKNS